MTTIEKLNVILEAPVSTSIIAYRTWLKEILKEQDKYKWHDLRKNPEDLPEVGKAITYLFEVDYGCMVRRIYNSTTATYDGKYHFAKRKCNGNTYTYIAWKYIEPFEEDE